VAAGHIQVAPDSTGKNLDADSLVSSESGTPTVYRQGVILSDPVTYANKARVGNSGAVAVRGGQPAAQTLAVTAATPVTGSALDVSEAGNATFIIKNTVAATAFTGVPVIVFEQSDDGTSWAPLQVTSITGVTWAGTPVIATGAANAEQMFDAALEGVSWVRVRVTTAQTTNGMTVVTQPGGLAFSPSVSAITPPAATGTLSSVSGATASTTLLSANANRKGALFFNDSTASLFLGFTAGAVSQVSYTVKIGPGALFEIPVPLYTGQVNGIWDNATGAVRVTELA
jgi:hypothetical protein